MQSKKDILIVQVMGIFDRYREDKENVRQWYAILEQDIIELIEREF